jgi:small subunit ribosomal protein S1
MPIKGNEIETKKKHKDTLAWIEQFEESKPQVEVKEKTENPFAKLIEESPGQEDFKEGAVVEGVVVHVGNEYVTVDVGYKCEGLIRINEFKTADGSIKVNPGDLLTVYVEKLETENGFLLLSKDRAQIIKTWDEISQACENDQLVEGIVIGKVKGGLSVDIGVKAFLPSSQIDNKPVKNLDAFIGKKLKFKILKFNKKRGNIILSRKTLAAEEKEKLKEEVMSQIQEGQIVDGVIKNITDYGAFIDLGGLDGLLHITDMSWGRVKHPSELFKVGDKIKVKVLKYDKDKQRISLGLKQVTPNPWEELAAKIKVYDKVKGKVTSIKDYGAFVELESGIEGLIHVSEMSWRRDVKHPSKVVNVGDEVECVVLEIDAKNKRLSLGLKQLQENPWTALESKYPAGTIVEGEIKSVTDFGIFLDIGAGIDGLIHVSDITWNKNIKNPIEKYKKGEKIKAVVLSIDKEAEKFSLGIKQLEKDPWEVVTSKYKVGSAVEGKITKITDFGAFVEIAEGIDGLIYVSELSDERIEKPSDAVKVGDIIRAEVISIDPKDRRIGLSVKKLKQTEEKEAIAQYTGNADKKMSLGDILGEKLKSVTKKE